MRDARPVRPLFIDGKQWPSMSLHFDAKRAHYTHNMRARIANADVAAAVRRGVRARVASRRSFIPFSI